ncbi:MAG: VWA domain-containing protein [Candidatus Poribacteria bacterium]|nr:VWA domain-containing protein [Candidatus Poribacteria bacterium]
MKNTSRRTVKSITRNALFISMILHVFFLITLFYFSVRNQSLLSFQDKFDATIETVPKPLLSKKPMKTLIHQQQKTNVFEAVKIPPAKVESITAQITFQPNIAPTAPVVTEHLQLKQNTASDAKVNVSTALRQLREVESGLSKTEAVEPTVSGSLGSRRSSGMSGIKRTPASSTLDFAETIGSNGIAQIDDIFEDRPSLPNIQLNDVMRNLASEILATSDGGPIDVVFVIDTSGSMSDNIRAVANHVIEMVDVYESSGVDYALGLTEFYAPVRNVIKVIQLTQNIAEYKEKINAIISRRGENALDAIAKTVNIMRFRATSKKHLILVTDEPFTSMEGKTVSDTIALCNEFGIYVNVLGISDKMHKLLAASTNGSWYAIPRN